MITYKQIRRARLLRDYSIKEMATKLHIDESTYAMLERGEIKISAKRVDELLVVFSMSYDFLHNIENRLSQLGN